MDAQFEDVDIEFDMLSMIDHTPPPRRSTLLRERMKKLVADGVGIKVRCYDNKEVNNYKSAMHSIARSLGWATRTQWLKLDEDARKKTTVYAMPTSIVHRNRFVVVRLLGPEAAKQ